MRIKDKNGFTLIEILIAVVIISIIILSMYSAFNTGILAYKKIDSAFYAFQEARIIFSRLEKDLRNSFVYSESSSFFKGTAEALEFFNVSQVYEEDKQYSDLCRIKYELDGSSLKRTAYSGLSALSLDNTVKPQDISDNIKTLGFEYAYITEKEKKDIIWQGAWPQEEGQMKQLPLAVKVKLALISKEERRQNVLEFTKIISLPQANISLTEEK